MQDNPFTYSTEQAARQLGLKPATLRVAASRGGYLGVKPQKVGKTLFWPRSEVLALAGLRTEKGRTVIDLRATNPWLESLSIPPADPIAAQIAIALNDPRDLTKQPPEYCLDEWHAIRGWLAAAVKRFNAASARLTPEQITNGRRLQALAVAAIVNATPPSILTQAVIDIVGGAA